MRTYYTAPIKLATFTNITINNGNIKYDRNDSIIDHGVIFYYNRFNRLVREDTKFPVTYEEDVEDFLKFYINSTKENIPTEVPVQYINIDDLIPINNKAKQKRKFSDVR